MTEAALQATVEGNISHLVSQILQGLDDTFKQVQDGMPSVGEEGSSDVVLGIRSGLTIARLIVANAREKMYDVGLAATAVMDCPNCSGIFSGSKCPNCGWEK